MQNSLKYILKYSPEITIKSRSVRTRFARQLGANLEKMLARWPGAASVRVEWDYVELNLKDAEASHQARVEDMLSATPGISSIDRVRHYPLGDMDDILARVLPLYEARLRGKTFALRCKRAGRHTFRSTDVERIVGGGLKQHSGAAGVSLNNPQVLVPLQIRDQDLYVVEQRLRGLGGFPAGSQDGVLSLLSGGFDSAVSSFLAMKRGLRTHFLFFNLGGREHEVAVKEVALYLWLRYGSAQRVKFVSVPFEGVVAEILDKVDNSQMGVVLKRMMLRAASEIARDMSLEALVTGESVSQVSSQTLANLAVIDKVSEVMVLRPLAMADKQEIVDIARRIGTEEFSAAIPEYCGVISIKPTTRAREHRIAREEGSFDFTVLEQAVADRRVHYIDRLQNEAPGTAGELELVASPAPGQVVLDIRHPDEQERGPLSLAGVEVEKLPFYRLNSQFQELDKTRHYLLYCDKGIMSRLHASYLREQGHENVGVYRPE